MADIGLKGMNSIGDGLRSKLDAFGSQFAHLKVCVDRAGAKGRPTSLAPGDYVIGRVPSADIIVPSLTTDLLARLSFSSSLGGHDLTLITLAEDVQVNGSRIARGHVLEIPSGAVIEYGGVKIRIEPPIVAAFVEKHAGHSKSFLYAAACLCVLALAANYLPAFFRPAANASVSRPAAVLSDGSSAESALKSQLFAANLSPPLVVTRHSGTLVVTGALDGDQRQRLNDAVAALGNTISMPLEVQADLDNSSLGDIAAVNIEPRPEIIMPDGRTFSVRDDVPGGGKVEKITKNKIVLHYQHYTENIQINNERTP